MKKKSIIVAIVAIVGVVAFLSWRSLTASTDPCPPADPCPADKIFMNANVQDDGTCHIVCKDIKDCAQAQKTCKDGNSPTDCKDNDKGRCVCQCAHGGGGSGGDCAAPCKTISKGLLGTACDGVCDNPYATVLACDLGPGCCACFELGTVPGGWNGHKFSELP